MTFRDFSKSLSDEIENLFATMGDSCLPEEAHRLDNSVSIDEIMDRIKNLDSEPTDNGNRSIK